MPGAPLGVIVTGIVPVWPGPMVIGLNEARLVAGSALSVSWLSTRLPGRADAVTDGSTDGVTDPAGVTDDVWQS